MLSNYSLASKTRASNRQPALSGHEVPIEDIDDTLAANHKLAFVPRPDLTNSNAREFLSIVTEPAKETSRPPLAFWSAVFADLMEGCVLYGASMHPNAFFPIELFRADRNISQSGDISPPRGFGAVVPYSASPREALAQLEHDMNRNASGETELSSVDAGVVESDRVTSLSVVRRGARWSLNLIACLWTYWRREREIKRAVYALENFDDRTLRDMGIQHRSQIEQTVRYGRDC
jgi:uncharacterized protein YjiS (DUF1127 family)